MRETVKKTLMGGCVIFTCSMGLWSLVGLAYVGPEYGLVITVTLLVACLLLAVLQTLWFTDRVLKRAAYPARMGGFGLSAFAVLAACAYLGRWLPTDEPGAWLAFAGIYLAILAAMTAGYALHYRRSASTLDEALRRYRSGRD